MDDSRQWDPEATSEAAARHGLEPSHDQSPTADGTTAVTMEAAPCISLSDLSDEQLRGTFFTHAHNFGVSGGTFQSIKNMHIHHAPPAEPPDFPTIPMGYLNLLRELRLNADTGVVDHHQSPVRRAHSARIHGSESTMTVAIYQGHKAEENWREAISKHSNLRHPNIIQLFGTARTSKIHAAIFHDELIPARQMAEKYDITPIGTVYLRYFLGSRSSVARNYVESVSGDYPGERECTLWIRLSTGALSLDLTRDDFDFNFNPESDPDFDDSRHTATGHHLLEPNQDSDIIADMSIWQYHEICSGYLSKRLKLPTSAHTSLKLGAVYRNLGADCNSPVEVAFVPDLECPDSGWENPNGRVPGQIMEDGWVCIPSAEVDDKYTGLMYSGIRAEEWLSQANHIFKCLNITSNYEDYVVLEYVRYLLTFSGPTDGLPPGYIFLCPWADLRSDAPTCFQHPDCSAYWSLDPTGVERLSAEEAKDLGFPSFEFAATAHVYSWDADVYDGLRQFHEAKGFDPYSQDVARHMGHRLFQLSDRMEAVSAHLEETNSEDDYDEGIHSEISVQDIPTTANIQSQTPQFAPYPTHLGLDVDLAADRLFGASSNHFSDAAFDSVSIPSSSTFSFPPRPPSHPAHLLDSRAVIHHPSAGSSHDFNMPTTTPEEPDALDPRNIPAGDFRARTADQPEVESQISERPHKKMRLEFIMGGGGI